MSKIDEAITLLRDFANPKKWELLGGHYYRCRSKSDAKKNLWPHELVEKALALLESAKADRSVRYADFPPANVQLPDMIDNCAEQAAKAEPEPTQQVLLRLLTQSRAEIDRLTERIVELEKRPDFNEGYHDVADLYADDDQALKGEKP